MAAKKAFVVNRVGDFGLTVAIFLMFAEFGSVSFTGVFHEVPSGGSGVATALGFLLLLGACGKSAQVPLQSWLLDAMEGPTPVSALIHAATMVTAGVYLLVRSNPILALSEDARIGIAVVGTVTLLFGGIIASAKDDIKKSLAGSTMSQIGYMTLGAGLGPEGYVFAIALLLAHGFYKAGLFLGAGSVIHGMDDEQDMRQLRGAGPLPAGHVRDVRPGLPGHHRHPAVLRLLHQGPHHRRRLHRARHGRLDPRHLRADRRRPHRVLHDADDAHDLVREAALGGRGASARIAPGDDRPDDRAGHRLGRRGRFLIINDRLQKFLAPVVGVPPVSHGFLTAAGITALVLALAGIALAWVIYGRVPVPETAPRGNPLVVAARKDLYGDTINESVLMRPGQWLTRLSVYFDNRGVDGLVNSLAAVVGGTSGRWRKWQTGFVRSYALSMFFGAAVLVALLLAVRL